jgi:hypothetical protein
LRQREKEYRKRNRYKSVPEGILIYRLDTALGQLSLMSPPHTRTDLSTLVTELKVTGAVPSSDPSRRGLVLHGADGTNVTLVATEQRTATAWLEAASLMLAKQQKPKTMFSVRLCLCSRFAGVWRPGRSDSLLLD